MEADNQLPRPTTMCCLEPLPRILCLHAFRTNAAMMEKQMHHFSNFAMAWEDEFELVCIDGVHKCTEAEAAKSEVKHIVPEPYFEWHNARTASDGTTTYEYENEALQVLAEHMRSGEYVGLMGFSQGGQLIFSYLLLSLRKPDTYPPPKFVVLISCFPSRHQPHAELLRSHLGKANVHVPALVTYGAADDHVAPEGTRQICSAFASTALTELRVAAQKTHRVPALNPPDLLVCQRFALAQATALSAWDRPLGRHALKLAGALRRCLACSGSGGAPGAPGAAKTAAERGGATRELV